MKSGIRQNLILVTATVICMVLAFVLGINLTMPSVVALEQDARCGIAEHIHREDCYLNNVLICGEKAHTHGENCYLLRLEDNDINRILSEIEADEEKSLEHVITNVVYKASYLELVNEGVLPAPTPTPTPTPTPLIELLPEGSSLETLTATNASVAALNDSIEENNITPALYLNERLISPASEGGTVSDSENLINLTQGQNSPTDLITYAANGNNGVSTLAVGGESNASGSLNIYIYVDGSKYVSLGYVQTNNYYGRTVSRDAVYNLIRDAANSNDIVVSSNLSSGSNLFSNYSLRYNQDNGTNGFGNTAVENDNYFGTYYSLGNGNGVFNAVLSANNSTTPINFYTVTLDRSAVGGANSVQYVQSGQNSTLTLESNSEYEWYDEDGNTVSAADLRNITSTTTLYARPKEATVTFKHGSTTIFHDTDTPPFSVTAPTHIDDNGIRYGWIEEGSDGKTYYAPGATVEVTRTVTYVSVPAEYYITLNYPKGNTSIATITYPKRESYTLPAVDDGYLWKNGDKYYSPGEKISVSSNMTFTAVEGYKATFVYTDGTTEEHIGAKNSTVDLPTLASGYYWYDEDGNTVTSDFALTRNITLYAGKPLTLHYDVNAGAVTNLTDAPNGATIKPRPPTISDSSATQLSEEVIPGASITLRNANPNKLTAQVSGDNGTVHHYHVVGYFVGWKVGNGNTILPPNANYTYADLEQYADSNGNIKLTGVWDEGWEHSANFFIKFNSALDGATGAGDYTPSVFTTYVGYASGYSPSGVLEGSSDKNMTDAAAIEADQAIRDRLGANNKSGADSVYLYDMPTDDEVFASLKDYVHTHGDSSELYVDEIRVSVDDLTSETFAVRWFVFKYMDTGWHIDGRLVRKEGNIVVHKTFEGREDYITAAQNGFTIIAQSGTLDTEGDFVDNTAKADKTLVTSRGVLPSDTNTIGYTEKTEPIVFDNGMMRVEYTWVIPKVGAGELWHIEEKLQTVENSLGLGEWVIVDSSNDQSKQGTGTKTIVEGVTFPKDVSSDEWLRAEFTNVYYSENSIMLRKIDALTRNRLEGAEFQLWQRTTSGDKLMTFDLIEHNEGGDVHRSYVYNLENKGKVTNIKSDGTEISVDSFSYELGPIIFREVKTPAGYVAGDNEIIIGYNKLANGEYEKDNKTGNYVIKLLNDTNYATFDKGLLTVENVPQAMEVKVVKDWKNCYLDEWSDTVTVQLMAKDSNGNYSASLAASVLPAGTSTVQTLTIVKDEMVENSFTWKNLPEYINGKKAEWTVKELAIGSEQIKSDGTFPNWNSYVSLPTESIENGVKTATITVTNIPKTGTELRLIKKDNFNRPVPDVTFVLKDEKGTKVLNTLTTDKNGELIFHNLKYATQYTLVEENIPVGYWGYDDPIKVTINEDGTVTILDGSPPNAKPSAHNYTIEVINYTGEPLPETGGMGTHRYTAGGLLLMAAAVALLIYRRKRRKEADLLDV